MGRRMTEPTGGELELQRRWAESRWPTPFLRGPDGEWIRVITPGRWNRGPGPDFRDAQILDGAGRARRGDVELHIEPGAWLQHGHAEDPAYRDLLLHIVERGSPAPDSARGSSPGSLRSRDARIPDAIRLPPVDAKIEADAGLSGPPTPPCTTIGERAGAAAVEARLLQIGQRRFRRKADELQSLPVPEGPGTAADRRAWLAAARALGQPHNAERAERGARRALEDAAGWGGVQPLIERKGWRRGRGALGSPEGLGLILSTMLRRWTAAGAGPWASFERLASLPRREAIAELRIARRLGPTRAAQLLADAVYPLTDAWLQWSRLPAVRYRRTDELRERIEGEAGAGFGWLHPQTQALLELERSRCRHGACRICPLAALSRGS